ncbi:MAG: hypothetical protein JKY65_33930 [Planctomycetes bacterium]|nr:hypothetical protein [Planctomycetota bacterium]
MGAIPKPLGKLKESLSLGSNEGPASFASAFYQVGPSVLAITTEIEEAKGSHRVLELLGLAEDLRLRINMTLPGGEALAKLGAEEKAALEAGRSLGQVRVWGNETGLVSTTRRALARQMRGTGLETQVLSRSAEEPIYEAPVTERLSLDVFSDNDLRVTAHLLELLKGMAAEGALTRAARQMAASRNRVRRKGSIVSYAYETHRAGTGVLHIRRREVEAGAERPGLVRTFVIAGLRGGARLRIRDLGGRAHAEYAGTRESVAAIRAALLATLGGRA